MLAIVEFSFMDDSALQLDSITQKFTLNWVAFRQKIEGILTSVCSTRRCRGNQLTAAKHTAGSQRARWWFFELK